MNNFFVLFGFIGKQEVKFSAPGEDSNALSAFSGEEEEEKKECGVQRKPDLFVSPVHQGSMPFYFNFNKHKTRKASFL